MMPFTRWSFLLGISLFFSGWWLSPPGASAAEPKASAATEPKARGPNVIEAVPAGYFLHAYDDCGIAERQPHVNMQDSYCWTFQTSDTDADLKSRSAVFSYKSVNLNYTGLDPKLSYVVALTYASDHVYHRVQSLWADGVQLHEPYALPQANAVRVVADVPASVTADGRMALQLRIHGEVNATVSMVELWAGAEPTGGVLKIEGVAGLVGDMTGHVLDLAYEPAVGAAVALTRWRDTAAAQGGVASALATATTQADGSFRLSRKAFDAVHGEDLQLVVRRGKATAQRRVSAAELRFEPVRYRPIPRDVDRPGVHRIALDGTWKLDPNPGADTGSRPLGASSWKDFRVPGQWRQQGFDIPQDRTVAVAREFEVPRQWADRRVFLRFDAIHAGVEYRLNGQRIGRSENLFTPVEWEITSQVRPGAKNRLDLAMKVDTVSERLSISSGYAFHNLGGIDRRVSLYALPPIHARAMRVRSQLDRACRDAALEVEITVDNPTREPVAGLAVGMELFDADGRTVAPAKTRTSLGPALPGLTAANLAASVPSPRPWSAEKPNLYRLVVELYRDGRILERIEQKVGFRRVDVRGSEIYLNGTPIKMAGVCRHETDPLSGRADTMRHGESDIRLIKGANLNYLRTSHYPPTLELVEAADRLGMYLEVEAPFCWVGVSDAVDQLREVLVPTSAMIDFYHAHPSIVVWSLGNESNFNRCFEISHDLVRRLDPTRPTTFNNPDPKRICETANLHYPSMPYDAQSPDDPRPILLGEYFFPVCHEQTDVQINPGLRELFGMGHANPDSAWGRQCAEAFTKPYLKPGAPPGTWSHIVRSRRVAGAAIWAAIDESYYFPDGAHAGYSWHHGYWGLLDAWRRPKPEWWLTKRIFSPVWFPTLEVDYKLGQARVTVPVENRYAFTDLRELTFSWESGSHRGTVPVAAPPRAIGRIEAPVPAGTPEGAKLMLRVHDARGELVQAAAIQLGRAAPVAVPKPTAGAPKVHEVGSTVVVEGTGFSLVFDKSTGEFLPNDSRHRAALQRFPSPHMTQYDFGDLAGSRGKPYAVYPDAKTRKIERVAVRQLSDAIEIAVRDHFALLTGEATLRIDRNGLATVHCDYVYSGPEMDTREAGVRFVLKPTCDTLAWKRWSEWAVFPDDSISRTEGRAKATRTGKRGADPEGVRPSWPWSLDQTELGTADFRSVKYHVVEASLISAGGEGVAVRAAADRHVRACLAGDSVLLHVLTQCPLGQVVMVPGDRLAADCTIQLAERFQTPPSKP